MSYRPDNPLMIQSDMTVLVEVDHPDYDAIRDHLGSFAELEKSPEFVHTYRISPLSLWNAAAAGVRLDDILSFLSQYSKFPIPSSLIKEMEMWYGRYGLLRIEREQDQLYLTSRDPALLDQLREYKSLRQLIGAQKDGRSPIKATDRGLLKQELVKIGYPVEDVAGYLEGAKLHFQWRTVTLKGKRFELRRYQRQAADQFYAGGSVYGGSGVLVLPCGAGKTVIGIAAAVDLQSEVLVLTSSITACRQWIEEFLDKTTLREDQIGEYSGEKKEIRPVTVTTYQILSYRKYKEDDFEHLALFNRRNWGLIIYDEVHLLPAPVFRITADIQAKRRLGLTATLIREDGREKDVFSLIGPKKYEAPWKELERQGWIAKANCTEIRVEMTEHERKRYAVAEARARFRIAAEAQRKIEVVRKLMERHRDDRVLIIGQYLDQLRTLAAALNLPLITGKTQNAEREKLYQAFRSGEIRALVVSKVANFAIDLPDANVAVQVSGQFGSRQEEAQRLGRILRPKKDGSQAQFYAIVTQDSRELDFAINRQRFLTEQGYRYEIVDERVLDDLTSSPNR